MGTTQVEYICRAVMEISEGTVPEVISRVEEDFDVTVRTSQVKDALHDLDDQQLLHIIDLSPMKFALDLPTTTISGQEPIVGDDHELSERAAEYAKDVLFGDDWPIEGIALYKITFETTSQSKKRHGFASYNGNNEVTITVSEKTYERGGWEATKENIRHELVHAWQYQNANVDTGHRNSFRIWVDAMGLSGRLASHYEEQRDDYTYIYRCPECEQWFGKHRLCKSVRQAAEGGEGSIGFRYCNTCEVKLHLVRENGSGDEVLPHQTYSDEEIKRFVQGEPLDVDVISFDEVEPTTR